MFRVLILIVLCASCKPTRILYDVVELIDTMQFRPLVRVVKDVLFASVGPLGENTNDLGRRKQDLWPLQMPFPCDVRNNKSPVKPNSVHKLRPGDIDVIAAMGDSLTSANTAAGTNLVHIVRESRGISWTGGGQGTWREFTTLPNILKVFNPKLVGFAVGDSYSHYNMSQLNVAEPGATNDDLLFMAKILLRRMQRDHRIDVKNDWKVISLTVGGNDLCTHLCYMRNPFDILQIYRRNLIRVLRFIRDNIPRTFVNIVSSPPVNALDIFDTEPQCRLFHRISCSCLFSENQRRNRAKYLKIGNKWRKLEEEVTRLPEFRGLKDFSVVYQPFSSQLRLSTPSGAPDFTLLAVDCFHMSQKGNAMAGTSLYRNMLQPVGMKDTNWRDIFQEFPCPTEDDPYIKTYDNYIRRYR